MGEEKLADVNEIVAATQSLLEKTVAQLKTVAAVKASGEPRLFFPSGIELIKLVVKVGLADVELTVAGAKGTQSAERAPVRAPATHSRDVGASGDSEDMKGSDMIEWHNSGPRDVEIIFDVNGCPLDTCKFSVPKSGGKVTTTITGTTGKYEYHRVPHLKTGGGILANPRIIIQ